MYLYVILPLISGCMQGELACRSRRCLAEMLIKKELLSQPQDENCTRNIKMPFVEYQTLSVVSGTNEWEVTRPGVLISNLLTDLLFQQLYLKQTQETFIFVNLAKLNIIFASD